MTIDCTPLRRPYLGVEWACSLSTHGPDAGAGRLPVLAGLPGCSTPHPKMRHELMQSTVEVVTGICGTVAEAKADLRRRSRTCSAPRNRRAS